MNKMRSLIILLTALVAFDLTLPAYGQTDSSCYAIKVLKNGEEFKERRDMTTFSKKGFFLNINFFYNLEFSDSVKIFGRVIDIKNDSIYITTSYNIATAKLRNINFDTLKYAIEHIKTLRLTTEEIYGHTRNISLQNYSLQTVKQPCCYEASSVIYRTASSQYYKSDTLLHVKEIAVTLNSSGNEKGKEITTYCYPYLTNSGIAFIYEVEGLIYIVGSYQKGQ